MRAPPSEWRERYFQPAQDKDQSVYIYLRGSSVSSPQCIELQRLHGSSPRQQTVDGSCTVVWRAQECRSSAAAPDEDERPGVPRSVAGWDGTIDAAVVLDLLRCNRLALADLLLEGRQPFGTTTGAVSADLGV